MITCATPNGASANDELWKNGEDPMIENDASPSIESNTVAAEVAPSRSPVLTSFFTSLEQPFSPSLNSRYQATPDLDKKIQIDISASVRRVGHRARLSIRDRTQPSTYKSPPSSQTSPCSVSLTDETRELVAIIGARQSNPPTCDCFEQIHSRLLAPAPTPPLRSVDNAYSHDPLDPFSNFLHYVETSPRGQNPDDGHATTGRMWKCDCSIPLDHPALFKPWKLWDVDRDERTGLISRVGEEVGEDFNAMCVAEKKDVNVPVISRIQCSRDIRDTNSGAGDNDEDHSKNASPDSPPIFGWPVNMAISTVDNDLSSAEDGLGDAEGDLYLCADTSRIIYQSGQGHDDKTHTPIPNTPHSPEHRLPPASGSALLIPPEINATSYRDSSDFGSATSSRYFSSSYTSTRHTDDGDDEDDEDDYSSSFPFTPRSLPSTSPSSFSYSASPTLGTNNRKRFASMSPDVISGSRYRPPQSLITTSPSSSLSLFPYHPQSPFVPRQPRGIFADHPYFTKPLHLSSLSTPSVQVNDSEDVFGRGA